MFVPEMRKVLRFFPLRYMKWVHFFLHSTLIIITNKVAAKFFGSKKSNKAETVNC